MTITRTKHSDTHWVFYIEDGSKFSYGKYFSEIRDGEPYEEGIKTEEECVPLLEAAVLERNNL